MAPSPPLFTANRLSHDYLPIFLASFLYLTKKRLNSYASLPLFKICSTYENFHPEIEKFRIFFNLKGYPTQLYDHCARLFLDKILKPIPQGSVFGPTLFCLYYTFCCSLPENMLSLTTISNLLTQKYIHLFNRHLVTLLSLSINIFA